jgi:hypothetical protein
MQKDYTSIAMSLGAAPFDSHKKVETLLFCRTRECLSNRIEWGLNRLRVATVTLLQFYVPSRIAKVNDELWMLYLNYLRVLE